MSSLACKNCRSTDVTVVRDTYGKAFVSHLQLNAQLRTVVGQVGGLLVAPVARALWGVRVCCNDCGWEQQRWRRHVQ